MLAEVRRVISASRQLKTRKMTSRDTSSVVPISLVFAGGELSGPLGAQSAFESLSVSGRMSKLLCVALGLALCFAVVQSTCTW